MTGRRILYGLILVATLLFQITNDNYLAPILLVLVLCLPFLSLLISLPAILGFKLTVSTAPASAPRNQEAAWRIFPKPRTALPLPRLTARLQETNLLTGETRRDKLVLSGVSRSQSVARPVNATHCGLLELQVKKLRAYDYLGLFAIPLRRPEPAQFLVEPVPSDPGPLSIPEGWGVRPTHGAYSAKKSLSEDYDLREYRPGDPLRSIHWKLSSKWDDLIVREPTETVAPLLLLTFDFYGSPERLDTVLDKLAGYCRALLAVQHTHAVQWLDPSGELIFCPISDEKEFQTCLFVILSTLAPTLAPKPLTDSKSNAADSAFLIHISPGEEDAL